MRLIELAADFDVCLETGWEKLPWSLRFSMLCAALSKLYILPIIFPTTTACRVFHFTKGCVSQVRNNFAARTPGFGSEEKAAVHLDNTLLDPQ